MGRSVLHALTALLLCALFAAAKSEEELPWSQLLACQGIHRRYDFCDTSLPLEDRVRDVIARLELSEKLEMLTARRSPLGAVQRLGIPEFNYGTNCVHAVKSRCTSSKCPTLFPAPPNLAATFNETLWEMVGETMAVELRVLWKLGVGENNENNLPHVGLTCWGPTINMAKDPRWGRNMETPGEDPFLAGVYGASLTRGMQGGVGTNYLRAVTTLKHFDAYGLESWSGYSRSGFNAMIEPYDLAATYFPAWKHAIRRANPKGVMCSYNAVNGVPMCANKPFINLLRNGWGFDGYVSSDTGAVRAIFEDYRYAPNERKAAVAAIESGVDVDSSSWGRTNDATPSEYIMFLPAAIEKGELDEQVVDDALFNALKIRFQLGLFDPPQKQPYLQVHEDQLASPQSKQLNMESTLQSIVLLQNPSNILPLRAGKRLAVIGPHANATMVMVGNYKPQICPGEWKNQDCMEGVFDMLAAQNNAAGGTSTMTLGSSITKSIENGISDAIVAAKEADVVIFMVGLDHSLEKEGIDREYIGLPGPQVDLVDAVLEATKDTNTQHVMVVLNGGAVSLDPYKDNDRLAIVDAFCPSFYGARAIADIVFGREAPSGKLPVTIHPSNLVESVGLNELALAAGRGRTHRYFQDKPLWSFGFGLSYTEFELRWHAAPFIQQRELDGSSKFGANPQCEAEPVDPDIDGSLTLHIEQLADAGQDIVLPVQVSNVGDWDSAEVVQVYIVPVAVELQNPAPVPLRQLATFKRVALAAGEKHCLHLFVGADAFNLADALGNVVVAPGEYRIVVSNDGMTDVALAQPIWLKGREHVVDAFPL